MKRSSQFRTGSLLILLALLATCAPQASQSPTPEEQKFSPSSSGTTAPASRKEIVDPSIFPPDIREELNSDATLSSDEEVSVKKLPPESRDKIAQCLAQNDVDACDWAQGRALNDGGINLRNQIQIKLFKKGCALGHLRSCRQYAGYNLRNLRERQAEELFLHKLNCDIGLIYSCEAWSKIMPSPQR